MQRRSIHRGGILTAAYDPDARRLDIEFDTKRIVRVESIGSEAAERFMNSSSPYGYWKDEIEDNYPTREISRKEMIDGSEKKKGIDDLKKLFGDI